MPLRRAPLLAALLCLPNATLADERWSTVIEERLSPASLQPSMDLRSMAGTTGFAAIRRIPDALDPREAFGLSRLRGLHVLVDADAFAQASTNAFTGGGATVGTTWLPCVLDDTCGKDGAPQLTFGLRLQHSYYTPATLRGAVAAPVDERPYAGLTQVAVRVEQAGLMERPARGRGAGVAPAAAWRFAFELGAGLLGPDAGGFEVQDALHASVRTVNGCSPASAESPSSPAPSGCPPRGEGWAHTPAAPYAYEVSNRPSIDLRLAGSLDFPVLVLPTSAAARAAADGSLTAAFIDHARATAVTMHAVPAVVLTPYARVDLGTTFVAATLGGQARVGWLRVHHGLGVEQSGSWELAFIGGLEGRLSGFNATIESALVRGTTNAVRAWVVGEARVGLLASTPLFDLALTLNERTNEVASTTFTTGRSLQLGLSIHGD